MTDGKATFPKRYSLTAMFVVVAAIGVVCAAIVRPLYSLNRGLKSEYGTPRVIQSVEQYVRTHDGNWPASWSDLDDGDYSDYQDSTRVNFDLSSEDILKEHELVYTSITPVTGEYTVYPHANRHLESLLQAIIEISIENTAN